MNFDPGKILRELAKRRILVGVPKDENERQDDAPLGNAELAYLQTFGIPEKNVPARPFMAPGIKRVQDRIDVALMAAAKAATLGDLELAEKNMLLAGEIAVASARNVITEGIPPPLQPATVAARARRNAPKKRRKATAKQQREFNERYAAGEAQMSESPTTPLYDTGQVVRSLNSVLEKLK